MNLSFYESLPIENKNVRNFDLLTINLTNDYEQDVNVKILSAQPLNGFFGASIQYEIEDDHRAGKTQIKFNSERISDDAVKIISNNFTIPASERITLFIYANRISKIPQISIHSDKGIISPEQEFRVNNRLDYMLYKNIRYIYILVFVCIGFYIFNKYQQRKSTNADKE